MLEQTTSPRNAWDWKEYADCFGPFATSDAAYHELDFHSNPGSFSTVDYAPGNRTTYQALLDKVQEPTITRQKRNPWGAHSIRWNL